MRILLQLLFSFQGPPREIGSTFQVTESHLLFSPFPICFLLRERQTDRKVGTQSHGSTTQVDRQVTEGHEGEVVTE